MEIIKNFCHQMSDFKAKLHKIRFRLGLTALPRPLAGFKGVPTSKGREGKGRGERGRKGREKERGGKGVRIPFRGDWRPWVHRTP